METLTSDVVYDLVAALDMYAGSFGSDETAIDTVEQGERDSVLVTLSNGDRYELRVRPI